MAEIKAALLIASFDYEDPYFRPLKAPAQDVKALSRVLSEPAMGGFCEVRTLINEPKEALVFAIEEFFDNRNRDDLLLLYFSCHGIKDDDGRLYYATRNTRHTRLVSTAVPAYQVNDLIGKSRSRRKVLVLDCCYSGAFSRAFLAKGDSAVGVMEEFKQGRGLVTLASSDAFQYSFEEEEVEARGDACSVFTRALVDGIETGNADEDGDQLISLDELYHFAYERVRGEKPQQNPRRSGEVEGDIIIACSPKPPQAAEVPSWLRKEIESDFAPSRLAAVFELNRLLDGRNKRLARSVYEALVRLKEDDSRKVASAAEACLKAEDHRIALEQEAERVAREKAERDRLAREKAEAERQAAEAERAARDRAEKEQLERTRQEAAARAEADRLAREKAEQDRLAREKAEAERQAAEAERAARDRAERERQERARQEAAARAEADRVAREKAEQERLAREKAEAERQAAKAERATRDRAERERQERARQEAAARVEADRVAREKAERERLAREKAEAQRQAAEAERAARDRVERERQERARQEAAARVEANRAAREGAKPDLSASGPTAEANLVRLNGEQTSPPAEAELLPAPMSEEGQGRRRSRRIWTASCACVALVAAGTFAYLWNRETGTSRGGVVPSVEKPLAKEPETPQTPSGATADPGAGGKDSAPESSGGVVDSPENAARKKKSRPTSTTDVTAGSSAGRKVPAAESQGPPSTGPGGLPTASAPKRITVSGKVQEAMLASKQAPVYPQLAMQVRAQGTVRLTAIIGRDGTIQNLTVTSGHPLLVPAALNAVKQWRYKPTLVNGEPVEVVSQINVSFVLAP